MKRIGFRALFSLQVRKMRNHTGQRRTKSKNTAVLPNEDSSCVFHHKDIPNFFTKQRTRKG